MQAPGLLCMLMLLGGAGLNGEGQQRIVQEEVKRLRALADRAAAVIKDRVAARDALALGRQLAQLDVNPEQVSCAGPCLMAGRGLASCGGCTQSVLCRANQSCGHNLF